MRKRTKLGLLALSLGTLTIGVATSATFAYFLNRDKAGVSHPSIVLRAETPNLTLAVTPNDPNNYTYTAADGGAAIDQIPYLTPCSSQFGLLFLSPNYDVDETYTDVSDEEGYFVRYNVAVTNSFEKNERHLAFTPQLLPDSGFEAIQDALRMAIVQMDENFESPVEDGYKITVGRNLRNLYVPGNTEGQIRGWTSTTCCTQGNKQDLSTFVFPANESTTYYFTVSIWIEGYGYNWLENYREASFSAALNFEVI